NDQAGERDADREIHGARVELPHFGDPAQREAALQSDEEILCHAGKDRHHDRHDEERGHEQRERELEVEPHAAAATVEPANVRARFSTSQVSTPRTMESAAAMEKFA